MNGYYAEGDQQVGPMTTNELLSLAESGRINDETLVWVQGMPDWKPFGSVKDSHFFSGGADADPQRQPVFAESPEAQASSEEAVCVECKNRFPVSEVVSYQGASVCGNCKPAFFQKVKEGGIVAGTLVYAGFWIRLVAHILDVILLVIVSLVFDLFFLLVIAAAAPAAAEFISFLLQLAVGAAYVTFFLGKYGATPGKMALSLKVVRPDGGRIHYGRAFCRYLAEYLSALILMIGYIIAAFDAEKRTLHDLICDTRVIRE